jgi:4-oxalomesaconate tautomerase
MSAGIETDLQAIPCMPMRGGTPRGPFFLESDLPSDITARNRVLLAAIGSPDPPQIDGLGGTHPLTSKVGIVRPSKVEGVDLDFLFAQLRRALGAVDTTPNCGYMFAAVLPFALEPGLIAPCGNTTTARSESLEDFLRTRMVPESA